MLQLWRFCFKGNFFFLIADMQSTIQVLHGAERGEPIALFLSPLKPSFNNPSGINMAQYGSQFTFFLTAPLQAFCQLVDYNLTNDDMVSELLTNCTCQLLCLVSNCVS